MFNTYSQTIFISKEEAAAKAEAAAKDLSTQQAVAVLGLALVAMGEDIGSEMLFRHFGHLLRYITFRAFSSFNPVLNHLWLSSNKEIN